MSSTVCSTGGLEERVEMLWKLSQNEKRLCFLVKSRKIDNFSQGKVDISKKNLEKNIEKVLFKIVQFVQKAVQVAPHNFPEGAMASQSSTSHVDRYVYVAS